MALQRDWKGKLVLPADQAPQSFEPAEVSLHQENGASIVTLEDGTSVKTNEDGTVEISSGDTSSSKELSGDFDENIADSIPKLADLATELLDGIEADIRSRMALVASYAKGIDQLGLKAEDRSGRRQRKNVSTIRNPLMLEAIIDFQSAAMAELLPAAGPCKVEIDGGKDTPGESGLAQQLESDLNHYLTTTATEYYPDTDRGLFYLGYGGTIFKKIYDCPLRKRPVSECVHLTDLIVSENATDLDNALRVTHKIEMSRTEVRRMQIAGVWRNVDLITTPSPQLDNVRDKIKNIQGINKAQRAKDQPYSILECYSELVPSEYGFAEKDAPDDMPMPYRITMDKDSRTVLSVYRAWKKDDELYRKLLPFVMFPLIPGMGFLALGFLHILGNSNMALTAILRILVDSGMFSNFPGGVKIKGTRQTTNEINPGPGEWPEIDTGVADDIRKALMPLPYNPPNQVFIALMEAIEKKAENLVGASKLQVGEGTANVPVGTIMAMLEQQTKNMGAVHKRLHRAQAQEFMKLKELFVENPQALYRSNPKARKWQGQELRDANLIPASDPNVPSQLHRIMLATAKVQLAQQFPQIYDAYKTNMEAWETMGVDASSFLTPPAPPPPDPKAAQLQAQNNIKQADLQLKQQDLQQKTQQQQREAADRVVQSQEKDKEMAFEQQRDEADRQSKEQIAAMQEQTERMRLNSEIKNQQADRQSDMAGDHLDFINSHLDRQSALQQAATRQPTGVQ